MALQYLNLFECPIAKEDVHRQAIFDMLPSLLCLDFKDREGNEIDYSGDEEDDEQGNKKYLVPGNTLLGT